MSFKVIWHPSTADDLAGLPLNLSSALIDGVTYKLSQAPHLIGEPLKATLNQLWRVEYSKYRAVYNINKNTREVIILAVKKRETVYKAKHIERFLRMAIALQQRPPEE